NSDSGMPTAQNIGSMPVNVFWAMILRPSESTRSAMGRLACGYFDIDGVFTSSQPRALRTDQSPMVQSPSSAQPVTASTRVARPRAAKRVMSGLLSAGSRDIAGRRRGVESRVGDSLRESRSLAERVTYSRVSEEQEPLVGVARVAGDGGVVGSRDPAE